jgi:transposase InsO family protein
MALSAVSGFPDPSPKARMAASTALKVDGLARFLARVARCSRYSDNGLVFTSRHRTRLVRSYGINRAFITPHCPQQNGLVERVIRAVKEQCVHRHRFEAQQHAMRVIGDWIQCYSSQRPHRAPGMKTPDEA